MAPMEPTRLLEIHAGSSPPGGSAVVERLVLSIAEVARALGVSDDLVYELTERGELPCLRFGRRKVVPRQAIDLIISRALANFDPVAVLSSIGLPDRRHEPRTG